MFLRYVLLIMHVCIVGHPDRSAGTFQPARSGRIPATSQHGKWLFECTHTAYPSRRPVLNISSISPNCSPTKFNLRANPCISISARRFTA
jgi:hypothetical protein